MRSGLTGGDITAIDLFFCSRNTKAAVRSVWPSMTLGASVRIRVTAGSLSWNRHNFTSKRRSLSYYYSTSKKSFWSFLPFLNIEFQFFNIFRTVPNIDLKINISHRKSLQSIMYYIFCGLFHGSYQPFKQSIFIKVHTSNEN